MYAKYLLIFTFVLILTGSLIGQYSEVEPNNIRTQANVLTLNDLSIISAEFNPASDIDYFTMEMHDTCLYYLTSVENDPGAAPNIELYREGSPSNILTTNVGGRNGNNNFRLSGYIPEVSGRYYARIFNTEQSQGAYKIRFAGGRGLKKLMQHELDNSIVMASSANALAESDTTYGALYPANDIDYYKISGTEGKQFIIGTTPILDLDVRDTDTYITLQDGWGSIIAENDDIGTVNTTSGAVNCTYSAMKGIFPATGNYYITVRSYYNENFDQPISETQPPTGEYGVYYFSGEPEPVEIFARYPHVEMPTLNSILVQWNTVNAEPTKLFWGPDESCKYVIRDDDSVQDHLVKISGLNAESKYYYRVIMGEDTTVAEHFYTAKPSTTKRVKFFVIGDTGSNVPGVASSDNQLQVTDKIMMRDYDFGLHAGDVNQGIGEEYDFIFYTGYRDILKNTPIFTSIGNHDTYHDNAQTYLRSFNLYHNNPDNTERYYSFNQGHAHFIALDTNIPYYPGSSQHEWLLQDLQSEMRAETMWTFVYFHHPPWSEGWPGYPGEINVRNDLVPLFEQYNVDMVFNGHTHDYERGFLNGVYYIITGAGGCSLEPGGQYYDHEHVTVRVCEYHFTYIKLYDKSLELVAINKDGQIIDELLFEKQKSEVNENDLLTGDESLSGFQLYDNYPNPYNPSTLISYNVAQQMHVRIEIYSILGEKVKTIVNEFKSVGTHKIKFDASEFSSGIYFYRMKAGDFVQQKKMLFIQ
jgi:hypothetical protein